VLIDLSDNLNEIQQAGQSNLPLRDKYIHLKQILERSCKEITSGESLQFPSLFSRLVFIAQKYDLPRALEWQLQSIRVKSRFLQDNNDNVITHSQYDRGKQAMESFFAIVSGERIEYTTVQEVSEKSNLPLDKIRVQVLEIDCENKILICKSENLSEDVLAVKYDVPHINNEFNETIERLWAGAQLNLIDVKKDEQGNYIPRLFILEPDYLIDASAIAECFQNYSSSHLHYFRRKFEQPVNSHYILLGNLANFFLDELIYAENIEDISFEDTFLKSFRSMPFEYAACKDIADKSSFIDFMRRAHIQFENIRRVIINDLPHNGFDRGSCILEPSFFSEKYGFQGRLDLLQPASSDSETNRIIELKSGKPPYPHHDVTLIAPNHEVQTTVYRLMIQSVSGVDDRHIYPTILYSSAQGSGENIRLAAPYKQLEKEILNVRNRIVATEHDLYEGNCETVEQFFKTLLDLDSYGSVPDFFTNKLNDLRKVLEQTSEPEKAYFYRYISFVTRELYLQKAGDESYQTAMSVSALWNTAFEERKNSLELIDMLEIENIDTSGYDMTIRFRRNESSECSNFREGEICILYPRQRNNDTILTNQILKGNIVEISASHALLRFRYKQRNLSFFEQYKYWTVEHDKLDHTYNSMFKGLFAFLMADRRKRNLLLGINEPSVSLSIQETDTELNKEQRKDAVIKKALAANDYFLIVGPPGTGKTSIFARRLIEEFYKKEDTNILIIAYTNKAVDELCEAVCNAFELSNTSCDKYIRIGTELSCGEPYRHRLLKNISQGVNSRKELIDILKDQRIFIGTLASIAGRPELFEIKNFDVAIIDEASQILEPQIIGLLPKFDKFIMIGDHKQLSTITLQNEQKSIVNNTALNEIGLYDCRESLFERLYRICQQNNWTHAYDTLTYHGRMHKDIADFVNKYFYENLLRTATERQEQELSYKVYNKENRLQSLVSQHRTAFIACNDYDITLSNKINEKEADTVVKLSIALFELYKSNKMPFGTQKTLGIITPYRNQIALIKKKLEETGIEELSHVMVDTVERYQGSQRDIIIVSFCFNSPYQLRSFTNMDREGKVDRKLNVALTRAREQLFLIGNETIMRQNPIYSHLIDSIHRIKNSDL
jgi:DNA replication ATP-dependent helicase Dna2